MTVLAFDVYGTLVDVGATTAGLARRLDGDADRAARIAARWRDKQLEYSFRRALMGLPADFARCTREALAFALTEAGAQMSAADRDGLLADYARLPFFPDARPTLQKLAARPDLRLFAFTNGAPAAARAALTANRAAEFFADIVSAADAGTFKPAPAVYRRLLKQADAAPQNAWLISANPFDILGAQQTGMQTAWIRRNNAPFDPWDDFPPPRMLHSLEELEATLAASPASGGEKLSGGEIAPGGEKLSGGD